MCDIYIQMDKCIACRNTNRSLTDINIKEFQVKQYHNNTNQDTNQQTHGEEY
jgi:hypothetical protein